ncbi:uncharacterized protein METZ01_LOCUS256285, partial [marine metagenome]
MREVFRFGAAIRCFKAKHGADPAHTEGLIFSAGARSQHVSFFCHDYHRLTNRSGRVGRSP